MDYLIIVRPRSTGQACFDTAGSCPQAGQISGRRSVENVRNRHRRGFKNPLKAFELATNLVSIVEMKKLKRPDPVIPIFSAPMEFQEAVSSGNNPPKRFSRETLSRYPGLRTRQITTTQIKEKVAFVAPHGKRCVLRLGSTARRLDLAERIRMCASRRHAGSAGALSVRHTRELRLEHSPSGRRISNDQNLVTPSARRTRQCRGSYAARRSVRCRPKGAVDRRRALRDFAVQLRIGPTGARA